MSRNPTPRPIRASGARDGHGRILAPKAGALYVHMHREHGLAHRHYVLRAWQVRILGTALARPMLVFYVAAIALWGWMAQRAFRVPLLQNQITELTRDAKRLDTLTERLTELQARYEQVQRMLSAASAARSAGSDSIRSRTDSTPATRGIGGR